jgi:hypothetical protein
VDVHVQACSRCAELLDELRAQDASFMASPLGEPAWLAELVGDEGIEARGVVPPVVDLADRRRNGAGPVATETRPASRTSVIPWVGGLFAMAAAIALVMTVSFDDQGDRTIVTDPPDGIRIKGRAFTLEVYAKSDGETRHVGSGGAVYPGERVGFKVYPRTSGYAMILGVDDKGHEYQCFPQGADKASAPIEASAEGIDLKAAMELDGVLGSERLVALSCPEPFTYAEVAAKLKEQASRAGDEPIGSLKAGCDQHEVRLVKRAPERP